ncbi:hypothetical protein K8I61_17940 [bacterium]|nr:hypothetical protein [bacterium]
MKRKERPGDIWKFSLTLGCILALVGGLRAYHGAPISYPLIGLGVVAAILGFAAPPVMRPIYKGGMFFADKMSFVVTRIVLTLFFVFVMTPYGLFFRLARKDLLDRYPHPERETYWQPRERKPFDKKQAQRMF